VAVVLIPFTEELVWSSALSASPNNCRSFFTPVTWSWISCLRYGSGEQITVWWRHTVLTWQLSDVRPCCVNSRVFAAKDEMTFVGMSGVVSLEQVLDTQWAIASRGRWRSAALVSADMLALLCRLQRQTVKQKDVLKASHHLWCWHYAWQGHLAFCDSSTGLIICTVICWGFMGPSDLWQCGLNRHITDGDGDDDDDDVLSYTWDLESWMRSGHRSLIELFLMLFDVIDLANALCKLSLLVITIYYDFS
jgi:hypothetical protein